MPDLFDIVPQGFIRTNKGWTKPGRRPDQASVDRLRKENEALKQAHSALEERLAALEARLAQ